MYWLNRAEAIHCTDLSPVGAVVLSKLIVDKDSSKPAVNKSRLQQLGLLPIRDYKASDDRQRALPTAVPL